MPNYDDVDPFAGVDKTPSLKFPTIGTSYDCTVTEPPKLVQSRDYKSGEPAWWDKDETQPKMAVVIGVDVNGEGHSVWAVKPSAMFRAIQEAQRAAGARITVGGRLQVAFVREEASSNPRNNPQKIYAAKYTPPTVTPGGDPFADQEPTRPARPTPEPAPQQGPEVFTATSRAPF